MMPTAMTRRPPWSIELSGETTGDLARRAQWEGHACPHTGQFALAGSIEGIELGPELLASLRVELPAEYQSLASLRGQGFGPVFGPANGSRTRADSIRHSNRIGPGPAGGPALAGADYRAAGEHRLHESGPGNQKRTGSLRRARPWSLPCDERAGPRKARWRSTPRSDNLQSMKSGFERCPRRCIRCGRNSCPSGKWIWTPKFRSTAAHGSRDATVTCRNMSFVYHKFPYRVRQSTGTLRLAWTTCCTPIWSPTPAGGPCESWPARSTPDHDSPAGSKFKAADMTVDDEALACLPEKTGAFVRALHPRGKFDFFARYEKTDPVATVMRPRVTLTLTDAAIRYDHFPYLLGEYPRNADDGGQPLDLRRFAVRQRHLPRQLHAAERRGTSWCCTSRLTTCRSRSRCLPPSNRRSSKSGPTCGREARSTGST